MKRILFALGILFFISMQFAAGMQEGVQNRRMGDIIFIKTDNEIAAWCNFNNQIVLTANGVLCVYNGKDASPYINDNQ